jgi:hypothetical protein
MLKLKKIVSLAVLALVISTTISASGTTSVESLNEKTTNDESTYWKTANYCMIRGEHVGGISPGWRIGFAFRINIYPDHIEYLEIKIDNEFIPVKDLIGYWFFGIIDSYSIPRIPAKIYGFLIYCKYMEI